MERHGYPEIAKGGRPLLNEEEELGIDGGLRSLHSGGESGLGGTANSPVGIAAIGIDDFLQDVLVSGVDSLHGRGVALPEHGAPLDVGGQESHSAGRELAQVRHVKSPLN
jgi:hypothetical protein